MELQPRLDEHVPAHGTWVGLSPGWVSMLWLLQLLAETDHRLNHVAPRAAGGLHTLRDGTGQAVHPLDGSDERLVTGLVALSDDPHWRAYVGALHPHGLLSRGSGPTQPPEPRSLQEAVLASRRAELVERAMGRLHRRLRRVHGASR